MSGSGVVGQDFSSKFRTIDVKSNTGTDFKSLLLSEEVLSGLTDSGFSRPSPVQFEAIPLGKCGLDLVVQAKSGTGKTCVLVVVALEMLNCFANAPQVLILAPTREIAVQITDVFNAIGRYFKKLAVSYFIGGLSLNDDFEKLKRCQVAIGTPGRIKQLITSDKLNTGSIRLFILDEADKLFDEAFQSDINWIYSSLPFSKQIVTLSATYPESLMGFLTKYMRSPTMVRLNSDDPSLLGISQYVKETKFSNSPVDALRIKVDAAINIMKSLSFNQCLIFSNYQSKAENFSDSLNAKGWPSLHICGSQDQKKRLIMISRLKNSECRILVSTDLTARGIDAENVNLILHIDVPRDGETYLHRIGRAGRFGSLGISILLLSKGQEMYKMSEIQRSKNLKIYCLPGSVADLWINQPESKDLWSCVVQETPLLEGKESKVNYEADSISSFKIKAQQSCRSSPEMNDEYCSPKLDHCASIKMDNSAKNGFFSNSSKHMTHRLSVEELRKEIEDFDFDNYDLKILQNMGDVKKDLVLDYEKCSKLDESLFDYFSSHEKVDVSDLIYARSLIAKSRKDCINSDLNLLLKSCKNEEIAAEIRNLYAKNNENVSELIEVDGNKKETDRRCDSLEQSDEFSSNESSSDDSDNSSSSCSDNHIFEDFCSCDEETYSVHHYDPTWLSEVYKNADSIRFQTYMKEMLKSS